MYANESLERAISMAVLAHGGQLDAAGEIYVLHPLRVLLATHEDGLPLEAQIASVLHDVVEDTSWSLAAIQEGFGQRVGELVDALTRRNRESYQHYIDRVVAAGWLARRIKEFDLKDNLGRIYPIQRDDPAKAARLENKYRSGLRDIWAADAEGLP